MYYVADTARLSREGVLNEDQVRIIRDQAREAMMKFAMQAVLTGGIVAATLGLILWLNAPLWVAVWGCAALASGLFALWSRNETVTFFGNVAALIGAGMLLGGAGMELAVTYKNIAGPGMMALGAVTAVIFGAAFRYPRLTSRFVCGAIFAMGVALHVIGLFQWADTGNWTGLRVALGALYAAAVIAGAGSLIDVRAATALAIVPFGHVLSMNMDFLQDLYKEPTLSILLMVALAGAASVAAARLAPRWGRHAGILAMMAGIVANFCAFLGSFAGDTVGMTIWGPQRSSFMQTPEGREAWRDAVVAFGETALVIPEDVFAALWALALVAAIVIAALGARRGLFNMAVTFAAIHALAQTFDKFGDAPLAYVIGGSAAIVLAWAMWRLDRHWLARRGAGRCDAIIVRERTRPRDREVTIR